MTAGPRDTWNSGRDWGRTGEVWPAPLTVGVVSDTHRDYVFQMQCGNLPVCAPK